MVAAPVADANSNSSNSNSNSNSNNNDTAEEENYKALVVDSGPIIRLTGVSTLSRRCESWYTVPAVMDEIRDAKARQHLESLPFELQLRDPSPQAMQKVVDFARQTGDFQSLSRVDLQVLALLYDLECESVGGMGNMGHVRTTPKRTVGVGKIQALGNDNKEEKVDVGTLSSPVEESSVTPVAVAESTPAALPTKNIPSGPKTWARLVNPHQASTALPDTSAVPWQPTTQPTTAKANAGGGGQFSDAEESDNENDDDDDDAVVATVSDDDDENDNDNGNNTSNHNEPSEPTADALQAELASDFPSLAAAQLVPYEDDEDDNDDVGNSNNEEKKSLSKEERERLRKEASLKPISKSGKLYNSFRKSGHLMKPKSTTKSTTNTKPNASTDKDELATPTTEKPSSSFRPPPQTSRILGGVGMSGQEADFEDDGEGWITTTREIRTLKATGALDPASSNRLAAGKNNKTQTRSANPELAAPPPISQRAACATTDFAMQNVILQMNLELLSVDGMKVRKLKSWVTRCGACYKVYTSSDDDAGLGRQGKRLFCDHCGSDMMQRVAASVDGKTGRLRLHLKKNYQHNIRGTKFSLPKPGSGNRFQGDLLLREDQLLMGAWNQKVKMRSGGKARSDAQSMFGRDIASNVGCHASALDAADIRVGFGRRNPNAAKGRERRGKKKKSVDRACGLRR